MIPTVTNRGLDCMHLLKDSHHQLNYDKNKYHYRCFDHITYIKSGNVPNTGLKCTV